MTTKKPRVKIQRPPDAAPNTAFTQLSQKSEFGESKIRIALDPSDLADDSVYNHSTTQVKGPVVYTMSNYTDLNDLRPSCRCPDALRAAFWRKREGDDRMLEQQLLLFLGFKPKRKKKVAK